MKELGLIKSTAGFTLLETLVTIALIGMIISWATADYSQVRQREKVDRVAQSLQDSIHFGQDYARHLSVPAALCAGTPADKCRSTDWSKGWTVFYAQPEKNGQKLQAVRTFETDNRGLIIQINNLQTPGKIILNGEGFVQNNKMITGFVCDKKQGYYSRLDIGTAQIEKSSNINQTLTNENCTNAAG